MYTEENKSIYILLFSNILLLSLIAISISLSKAIGLFGYIPISIINRYYIEDGKKVYKNIDGIIVWIHIFFIVLDSFIYLNILNNFK